VEWSDLNDAWLKKTLFIDCNTSHGTKFIPDMNEFEYETESDMKLILKCMLRYKRVVYGKKLKFLR